MARKDSPAPPEFESSLARLEAIVRELEAGEQTLEDSLTLFQEGVELARLCQQQLDAAEAKVEKLLDVQGGNAVTEPFQPGDVR